MPKPAWDKKTISTYVTPDRKAVWEENAYSECKRLADFIRDRVESTINNEDLNGSTVYGLRSLRSCMRKPEMNMRTIIRSHHLKN